MRLALQCQTDVDGENIMTMWWRNIVGSGEVFSGANAVKAVTTNQEVMLEKVIFPLDAELHPPGAGQL